MVENILSIDVEEVFHGEYARQYKSEKMNYRTPENIPSILKFLGEKGVKATFFIVGEIAEKFPEIIEMILEEGHEVAFHGWNHEPLWRLTPDRFSEEIRIFKSIHPQCIGFRAPSFSLNNKTKWALSILKEAGFSYDSSIFPTWTPLYGVYSAPIYPYTPSLTNDIAKEDEGKSILEFPLSVYELLGLRIPIAGGFWLRFWNLKLIKRGIRKMNEKSYPAVFYIHNWELDEGLPTINMGIFGNFQVYYNLNKTKRKLMFLLKEFHFTNFITYISDTYGM